MAERNLTDAELDRIAARAVARLDERAVRVKSAEPEPTRAAYDVRSAQTGAAVIVDVPRKVAETEAERLNAEARQLVGRVPTYIEQNGQTVKQREGGRPVFAAGQRGEATEFLVVAYERLDERAAAKRLRDAAAEAREAAPPDDETAEANVNGLEQHAEALERQADELDATHRAAARG